MTNIHKFEILPLFQLLRVNNCFAIGAGHYIIRVPTLEYTTLNLHNRLDYVSSP